MGGGGGVTQVFINPAGFSHHLSGRSRMMEGGAIL